jgi:16S rRNA (guanine527-N7)-methyltransferase
VAEWKALRQWARTATGLELGDPAVDQLRRYVELLRVWNRKLALVADDDPTVVLHRHVADSLFAAAHCRDARAVADLGSGAGFPGLVIAITWPATRVTLIEARGKKVSFLEEACRTAGIRNAEPIHGRIEAVSREARHRSAYDCVTSRALADLDVLRSLARPLARENCRLVAMRSASAAVPAGADRIDYTLPDGTPRTLVIVAL